MEKLKLYSIDEAIEQLDDGETAILLVRLTATKDRDFHVTPIVPLKGDDMRAVEAWLPSLADTVVQAVHDGAMKWAKSDEAQGLMGLFRKLDA